MYHHRSTLGGGRYNRSRIILPLGMLWRNHSEVFIIAAFALSKGIIDDKMYGAVVLAVLLSAITSPFLLMKTIQRYKNLYEDHLNATNPEKEDSNNKMPLFLHIHIEIEEFWCLLDKTRKRNEQSKFEDRRFPHNLSEGIERHNHDRCLCPWWWYYGFIKLHVI